MPAITFTAVRTTEASGIQNIKYGGTIAAGVPLYQDPADLEYKPAAANAAATAGVTHISLTPGVDGGYGVGVKSGNVIFVGATMTTGLSYYLAPATGQIVPEGDVTAGSIVTRLGTAVSATELKLNIEPTGITK
jgi:hypothetical protein